jgi:hypothetical protein
VFQSRPASHSCSGTSQGPDSQPEFQTPNGVVHPPPMQAGDPLPPIGDDPFIMHLPAKNPGIQDIPPPDIDMHGPLSQEGRNFQWQLPDGMPNQPPADIQQPIAIQPPVPIQPPAQVVAGVRCAAQNRNIINHTARQVHPRFPDKL